MSDKPKTRSKRLTAEQVFASITPLGHAGHSGGFGVVRDVSQSGIALLTPDPPPVPCKLKLSLSVEEELFELTMIVRRVQALEKSQYLVGMTYADEPQFRDRFLRAFLTYRSVAR